jgi:integrase/recombinase XerD
MSNRILASINGARCAPYLAYATRLLEKDVQLVDIQALLGHESIATTQIYTHAGQERLSKLVVDI